MILPGKPSGGPAGPQTGAHYPRIAGLLFIALFLVSLLPGPGLLAAGPGEVKTGPQSAMSPTETAMSFYRSLRQRKYVEGFRHSVYRKAVEGLSPAELQDLDPDFARTFSNIPEKIVAKGEQITKDFASVFMSFNDAEKPETVTLIKIDGEWLVGDIDTYQAVQQQGRAFFFNARLAVNESEVADLMAKAIGAEILYAQRYQGQYAELKELIRLGGLPKDLEGGESGGYRFALTISPDHKEFFVTAAPVAYGKTGRLSFYANIDGIRAEDIKGGAASVKSPRYQPN